MIATLIQGSLFTNGFVTQSITNDPDWKSVTDQEVDELQKRVQAIFTDFPTGQTPNEARTEDDLIWPILDCLGWKHFMRQQNLSVRGRDDVPDGLLFADIAARAKADGFCGEWQHLPVRGGHC